MLSSHIQLSTDGGGEASWAWTSWIVIHPPPHDPTVPTPAADTLRSSSDPATFEVRVFTLATDVLAVDGATAVVLAEVRYGDPLRQEYRDLWVIRLRDDGRCSWFEEWPCWPGRPFSARDDQ